MVAKLRAIKAELRHRMHEPNLVRVLIKNRDFRRRLAGSR
jgi:hypothetical protein